MPLRSRPDPGTLPMERTMSGSLEAAAKDHLVRYGGDTFPTLFTKARGTVVTDSQGRHTVSV